MPGILKELVHLAKHSVVYGLSNMLGKAIGFLLIPLYTHYIPPADYGVLEILDLTVTVIGMFVGLGIGSAVAKFYYDYDGREDRCRVVSSAVITLVILAGSMIVVFWPVASNIAYRLLDNPQLGFYVKISLATFALNAVLEIPLTYIRAQEKSVLYSIVALARLALSLVLNIYLIVFLNLGILGILYSGLITSTIFSIGLVVWCLCDVGFAFDRTLSWGMVVFGAPLILNSFGMFIINFGDRFLLKATTGMAEVGVYSLGYKIGMGFMSMLIGQPFFLIWSVRRYSMVKEPNGLVRYGQVFLLYVLLLLTVWLVICAFSRELISLLAPPQYGHAALILPLVAFGYLLREISDFFRGAFMIQNKTGMIGLITSVTTIFCVGCYWLLIPAFAAQGAAAATIATFVCMVLINGYYALKIMPVEYRFGRVALLICLYIIIGAFSYQLGGNSFNVWSILLKLILILSASFLSFYILLSRDERTSVLIMADELTGRIKGRLSSGA